MRMSYFIALDTTFDININCRFIPILIDICYFVIIWHNLTIYRIHFVVYRIF